MVRNRIGELASDLRYAFRIWRRQPGLVAIAVLSLAAGIGLNTAVFSIINTIFFQSIRGVPEASRVASIGGRSSYGAFREIRDNTTTLSGVAAWQPLSVDIRLRGVVMRRAVPVVSAGYFATLDVRPARGRFFEASRTPYPRPLAEVVLDHEFWTEAAGADEAVIGETVLLNGTPAMIIGVAPAAFHGFGPVRPPLWASMDLKPALTSTAASWEAAGEGGWRIIGRLAPGMTVAQVNAELLALATHAPQLFAAGALRATTGPEQWSGPVSPEKRIEFLLVVVLPLVIVGLILWIGCSNVANLLLASAAGRRKEIAIRLANGATRWRVIRLLLTESVALAAAGGTVGVLIAGWTVDFVRATLPDAPRLAVEIDVNVLLYTAFVSLLSTILFGLAPALHGTRVDVLPLLKGESAIQGDTRTGARIRRFFLVTQFACSMALLIVAGTFVRSLVATHAGQQSAILDHVIVAMLETTQTSEAGRRDYWLRVREELKALPQVKSVTLIDPRTSARMRAVPEGVEPSKDSPSVAVQHVDAGYLATSGIQLAAGRADLADALAGTRELVLVNEPAARQLWGAVDATGKRLSLDDARGVEVAGVIRDDGREPRILRRLRDETVSSANVMVRTIQPAESLLGPLRAAFLRLSPDRAFTRVSTLRDAAVGPLQRLTNMAVVIAVLVLALASIGLYGSVSFVTSQRTREIAIRVAIGASRPAVLRLLGREGVLVVGGGAALGLALTAAGFQFMSGMIFDRWTLDPITVLGVLLTFSLVTLAACYVPGRRAMRIEPMAVLRAE